MVSTQRGRLPLEDLLHSPIRGYAFPPNDQDLLRTLQSPAGPLSGTHRPLLSSARLVASTNISLQGELQVLKFLWFMQEYGPNFFDRLYYFAHKQTPVK